MSKLSRKFTGITPGLVVVGISLMILGGCGYKDRPLPPDQVVPKAVTDLHHQLTEKGVTLYWSYPIETITGEDITDITSFEMYRAVVPADSYCDSCPIPFGQSISMPGGALPNEGKKTASYQATLLRPGNLYFFKVRAKTGWWAESKDSNVVRFLWNTPPLAPEGLTVKAGDKKISLKWQAVTTHLDSTPMAEKVQYQVYRSSGGGSFSKIGEPVSGTLYVDTKVVNGREYSYQVQALSVYEEGMVGGGLADAVAASPIDRTAPASPTGVRGIKTAAGIKVFWVQVKAKDLKGYRVYRRSSKDSKPVFIGEVDALYNIFLDSNPSQGVERLFYSVSSIDKQSPSNESARSSEVKVMN